LQSTTENRKHEKMECNETGWSSGDDLPLSTLADEEACVVNDAVFMGAWITASALGLLFWCMRPQNSLRTTKSSTPSKVHKI
jgi:hypothetical protein